MTRRTTVYDLQSQKGRTKWLQLHVDNAEEAAAAIEAGIAILSCEPDHHLEGIRAAAPTAFLSVGMPHGAVASPEEAIAAGEELGWDVVLKATAERLRQRPDQAHVWRNIDDADEMADAWNTLGTLIAEPERAGFVVQKNSSPGVASGPCERTLPPAPRRRCSLPAEATISVPRDRANFTASTLI